ncbi:hypothetical protein C7E17_27215, partial [Stenotrophomonas maltophilia]
ATQIARSASDARLPGPFDPAFMAEQGGFRRQCAQPGATQIARSASDARLPGPFDPAFMAEQGGFRRQC